VDNKVCYDGLGCFSSSSPFNNAYGILPDYPRNIQVCTRYFKGCKVNINTCTRDIKVCTRKLKDNL